MDNKVLAWLDRAITTLAMFVDIIPGKIDDFALSFLKWARNDPTFLSWLENSEPTPPNALTAPPVPLTDAFRRWRTETGVEPASVGGNWMELLGYVMQIIQWIQSRRAQTPPAPLPS